MDDVPHPHPPRTVHLDGQQIRTLAHPLRARLLGALRIDGPATATTLARALDTNTGATSYHLRQLADAGLVQERSDLGTGRQRFWRAVHDNSSFRPTDFDDDPHDRAAVTWIEGFQLQFLTEQTERWLGAQHETPREWREAATLSDALLTLSPTRLRELNDELWHLIQRYQEDESLPGEDGAAQVHLFLAGFPRTGTDR